MDLPSTPGGRSTSGDAIREGDDRPAETARQPSGALGGLSRRALVRLARRADAHRRRDVNRFEALADELEVSPRQLRILADAWAEGGKAGVLVLGPTTPYDDAVMRRAETVIETWRRRHYPMDVLKVQRWRNRITVKWMVPGEDPTKPLQEHPLMQLRCSPPGRWHLYRMAVQGEWWPVVVRGRRRRQALSACLDAVRVDLLHHFWGAEGPPPDLARGDALPDWPLD